MEDAIEYAMCYGIVMTLYCHFEDVDKVTLWLMTENKDLGFIRPAQLIADGHSIEVFDHILKTMK